MRHLTDLTSASSPWNGLQVVVAGLGMSGFAAATALLELGAQVVVVDSARPGGELMEKATLLEVLGAQVLLGATDSAKLPSGDWDLVVASPGWPPTQPLLSAAAQAGIPIWSEVELAWRMRPAEGAAPWLAVTGTNGKTTTVQMLTSILTAAGLRACSAGNVGRPVTEVVRHPDPYDVIALELSSFQLHWTHTMSPQAAVVLNVAPDHLDWHGGWAPYAAAKGRIYHNCQLACVYNEDDAATRELVEAADVVAGCRAVGFTLGVPAASMLGVVDGVLADRAFLEQRRHHAIALTGVDELGGAHPPDSSLTSVPAPHIISNALAAAALARAHGVHPAAVAQGLARWRPEPHRIATVATIDGVLYVDDSKATNPHAAASSLAAYDSVVWIAGGLLKGSDVDDLVRQAAARLRGVVVLGADRAQLTEALTRHAPDVTTVDISSTDTEAMNQVVRAAASLAQSGDVVLLAPAAASLDMFANYAARGDAFAEAVHRLRGP